jgi:hypothetical protein
MYMVETKTVEMRKNSMYKLVMEEYEMGNLQLIVVMMKLVEN